MRCAHPHAGAHPHGDYLDPTRLTTTRSRSAMSTADVTTTPVITLTDNAAAKVAELIAQESDDLLSLRVGVRPGGCSGFSYEMFFDADVADDDVKSEQGGVQVVIDPASMGHLGGGQLDYRDGIQVSGFHISNPNAERTCGCGQSFS